VPSSDPRQQCAPKSRADVGRRTAHLALAGVDYYAAQRACACSTPIPRGSRD
jgi:hypothetical protein